MARSAGQHSYGCALYSAALDTAPPAVVGDLAGWTAWAEVISLNGVPIQSAVTRLTHLASPDKAHEKIGGFIDGGQLAVKLNATAATLAALAARVQGTGAGRSNSNIHWFLHIPDPTDSGLYFEAFLQQFPLDIPEDDRVTSDVTLEISGLPTLVAF